MASDDNISMVYTAGTAADIWHKKFDTRVSHIFNTRHILLYVPTDMGIW